MTERQLGAIVGVDIPIDQLLGKWKAIQNRSNVDKMGVVTGPQPTRWFSILMLLHVVIPRAVTGIVDA